ATEIPVHHAEREFGDSKYSFMRLINLMYDLVTCLTTTPLRLFLLAEIGLGNAMSVVVAKNLQQGEAVVPTVAQSNHGHLPIKGA
ncbi:hypothetical protein MJM59_30485, partial [Salmonella enterica subsp. enterica serovar Montevideo]|nr:hypothetical protein [Salmonella enterica subsp. enterica serovar Montevideo]